ncbi:MAG TPA: hypothetical protein VJP88_05835 [Caulobacteraceae bacterium]|nr:hypothetical protein [Caulobacteraceae bacterium]
MGLFTLSEIQALRVARARSYTFAERCELMRAHSRDEVLEANDALVRFSSDVNALAHVNRVLTLQARQVPLINGREHWTVTAGRGRKSYGVGL